MFIISTWSAANTGYPAQITGFVLHTRSQIVFHHDIAETPTLCGWAGVGWGLGL